MQLEEENQIFFSDFLHHHLLRVVIERSAFVAAVDAECLADLMTQTQSVSTAMAAVGGLALSVMPLAAPTDRLWKRHRDD